MKDKKGWTRIIEAFIAVILIAITSLIILNQGSPFNSGASKKIYELENSILLEIRLNNTLRDEILNLEPLPNDVPQKIQDFINSKIPSNVECQTRVCSINSACSLSNPPSKNIYAKSIIISTNLTKYSPRQLRLFCWQE